MKTVRLPALRTRRLYPSEQIPGTQRLSRPLGHSADGWIKSMKYLNDPTGNRNHDLLACGTVPQPPLDIDDTFHLI